MKARKIAEIALSAQLRSMNYEGGSTFARFGVTGVEGVPMRRVAELVFWAIVGGQEVRRRKVSLRCAPKSVRRWCRVESQNQL